MNFNSKSKRPGLRNASSIAFGFEVVAKNNVEVERNPSSSVRTRATRRFELKFESVRDGHIASRCEHRMMRRFLVVVVVVLVVREETKDS